MVTSGLNYCQDLFSILRLEHTIRGDSWSENPAAPPAAFFHSSNKIRASTRYLERHSKAARQFSLEEGSDCRSRLLSLSLLFQKANAPHEIVEVGVGTQRIMTGIYFQR